MMMVRCSGLLALLVGALAAQDRGGTAVRAIGADGRPVGGARVTAFADPLWSEPDGPTDVVHGATDERGRCVLRLLAARHYRVFAVVDAERVRASDVEQVDPGGVVELRLLPERDGEAIRVDGLDRWPDVAPLRVQVSPVKSGGYFVDLADDGRVESMPPVQRTRVVDRDGVTLWQVRGGYATPMLPPPRRLPVRVRLRDGTGVAGAEVWQRFPGTDADQPHGVPLVRADWRLLGSTDARGELVATVAFGQRKAMSSTQILVEARPARHTIGRSGIAWGGSLFVQHKGVPVPADGVLPIHVEPLQRLRVAPAGRYQVTLLSVARATAVERGEPIVRVGTDGDGEARVPLARDFAATRLARVDTGDGAPAWAVAQFTKEDLRIDCPTETTRFELRDEHGNPANSARAYLVAGLEGGGASFRVPVPIDRAGRLAVRVDDRDWLLFVRHGRQAAWHHFAPGQHVGDVLLTLREVPHASVRFVGPDGRPVASAVGRAGMRRSLGTTGNDPALRLLGSFQQLFAAQGTPIGAEQTEGYRYDLLPLPGIRIEPGLRVGERMYHVALSPGDEKVIEVAR